jgi:hypothetical protein
MNDDAVREKLRAALSEDRGIRLDILCGRFDPDEVIRALLETVRKIAAEELREAAKAGYELAGGAMPPLWLIDRADALTKPPDGPDR